MTVTPPEVTLPHAGKRRVSFIDTVISLSALIVSGASIAVALDQGRVMEQLVIASSMPYVRIGTANTLPRANGEYARVMRVELRNNGVGPADVRSVHATVDGVTVRNIGEWISRCCADAEEALATRATLTSELVLNQGRHFIPAGQSEMLFEIERADDNASAWQQVELVRQRTDWEVCYCSVFDDCWIVRGQEERVRAPRCVEDEDAFVP